MKFSCLKADMIPISHDSRVTEVLSSHDILGNQTHDIGVARTLLSLRSSELAI